MISVGEALRRERLRRNLDLDQISSELKISAKFLDAIENEQFERLPARIFAKSFVRQYAHLLELDEDELAEEVQRVLQPPPSNPLAAQREAAPEPEIALPRVDRWEGGVTGPGQQRSLSSSLPALALFVVILLVCSGIYSLWQRSRHNVSAQENVPVSASARQPEMTAVTPPPAETSVAESRPAAQPLQSQPATQPRAEQQPVAGVAERASERPAPVGSAETPAGAPPAVNTPPAVVRATTNPNPTVRVEVTAAEAVWVLAQNDGKYLFSGTMEPNQSRTIESDGTVTLRLGNAGGVNILLNGKPVGAVGPRGQVRTVQFTSGGFHIVPAPKPSVPLDDIL